MKNFLKYLGVILVIIGSVVLIACYSTANVNYNATLGLSLVLVVVGLIVHIIMNKRITD